MHITRQQFKEIEQKSASESTQNSYNFKTDKFFRCKASNSYKGTLAVYTVALTLTALHTIVKSSGVNGIGCDIKSPTTVDEVKNTNTKFRMSLDWALENIMPRFWISDSDNTKVRNLYITRFRPNSHAVIELFKKERIHVHEFGTQILRREDANIAVYNLKHNTANVSILISSDESDENSSREGSGYSGDVCSSFFSLHSRHLYSVCEAPSL